VQIRAISVLLNILFLALVREVMLGTVVESLIRLNKMRDFIFIAPVLPFPRMIRPTRDKSPPQDILWGMAVQSIPT
jgi:hypothetical protein